jgi:ABC transport system ATP-binding/permease protein
MPLLRLETLSLHYGSRDILKEVDFTLRKGEKIGLLGRNGEGKTTLLKALAGEIQPDSGTRWQRGGTTVAWLEQTLLQSDESTVYEVVAGGLPEIGQLISDYHEAVQSADMGAISRIQEDLENNDGWQLQQKVETTISQLQLSGEAVMATLSGGWRKRVALARVLVSEPDVLLLDEPTNHLDIPTIEWLEKTLQQFRGALVLVTHDRAFLQKVSNSIVEIDRGTLYCWQGTYRSFVTHRAEQLEIEEKNNALFDKRLAREEVWIRQGIKARRTRNEGRVRALKALREKYAQRVPKQGYTNFRVEAGESSGKLVCELDNISMSYDGNRVIKGFSTRIMRGDRVGIIGPNGAGKSTLLRILLGELKPEQGSATLGTKLAVAYFDQLRNQLDYGKSLIDNVCGGQDFIEIDGKKRHAISYLNDFLFSPDRVRQPIGSLSGGEQSRAILANLFSKAVNLLVLDEPTNDLDIETLELLEELLLNFQGTVLLVSHDREFMDNTTTRILAFEGKGRISETVGGYSDWLRGGGSLSAEKTAGSPVGVDTSIVSKQRVPPKIKLIKSRGSRRIPYKLKKELDALPGQIESLEERQSKLEKIISGSDFYSSDNENVRNTLTELSAIQKEIDSVYRRWQELESAPDQH